MVWTDTNERDDDYEEQPHQHKHTKEEILEWERNNEELWFDMSYEYFLGLADGMMCKWYLGWGATDAPEQHSCGSSLVWIGASAPGNFYVWGCVRCHTPRLIFTDN